MPTPRMIESEEDEALIEALGALGRSLGGGGGDAAAQQGASTVDLGPGSPGRGGGRGRYWRPPELELERGRVGDPGRRLPFVEPPIEPAFRVPPPRLYSPLRAELGRGFTPGYNPPPPPVRGPADVLDMEWGGREQAPEWARRLGADQPRPRTTTPGPQGFTPRGLLASRPTSMLTYAPLEAELAGAAAPYAATVGSELLAPGILAAAATVPLGYAAYRAVRREDPDVAVVEGLTQLAGQHGRKKILDLEDVDPVARDWLRANPVEARRLANRGIIGADLLLYAEQVEPIKPVWPSGQTTAARLAGPEEWMPWVLD